MGILLNVRVGSIRSPSFRAPMFSPWVSLEKRTFNLPYGEIYTICLFDFPPFYQRAHGIAIVGSIPRRHCVRAFESTPGENGRPPGISGMRKAIHTFFGATKASATGRFVFSGYIIVLLALFVFYNYFPGLGLSAICAYNTPIVTPEEKSTTPSMYQWPLTLALGNSIFGTLRKDPM